MSGRAAGVLASSLVASPVWTPRTRARLLRALGARVGPGTKVHPGIRFIGAVDGLRLGRGAFVNTGLTVGAHAPVEIGERVHLGPNVTLLPTSHELGPSRQRAGEVTSAPIIIGDGAWLGAGVTVLGGVRIGAGCVVAAGAVVTSDTDPDAVYGGVPARLLRLLDGPGEPGTGTAAMQVIGASNGADMVTRGSHDRRGGGPVRH